MTTERHLKLIGNHGYLICFSSMLTLSIFVLPNIYLVDAQSGKNNDTPIIIFVNLQRLYSQLALTNQSVTKGDVNSAFAHSYLSHSAIFPSVKLMLANLSRSTTEKLESSLTDLPFMIRSNPNSELLGNKIKEIRNNLNNLEVLILNNNNSTLLKINTIELLLQDISKYYKLSNATNTNSEINNIDYENAQGLTTLSKSLFVEIASNFDYQKRAQIASLLDDLEKSINQKSNVQVVNKIANSTQSNIAKSSESIISSNTSANKVNAVRLANITELSRGFDTYSGVRRGMGDADDSAKAEVRNDIDEIRFKLLQLLQQYKDNQYDQAFKTARSAYLDSYESIEIPLRPIDPDFTLDVEIKFAELRNFIQLHQPYENIEAKITEIRRGLDESERLVSGTGIIAPALAFSTSFSIIFREGLESALIIGAILTYLEASRNDRYKKHVYLGIVISIGATFLTWFVAEFLIEISGASRDIIEAIAGISAVAVLFWVSFWILNKIETRRWIEFVKAKVWQATTTGSVMVFAMLSFFTVYREGFETVLFYQAMLSFAHHMEFFVILGLVVGLAIIVSIVFIIKRLGKKLPLRVLFGLTMGVGAYMSIAFIGNAVRELQEVGIVSTTPLIGIIPRLDINFATMTGIHPTLETVLAQTILLSIYTIGAFYILVIQPRKKKIIETSRKSMGDLKRS